MQHEYNFLDLPIYRCTRDLFNARYEFDLERHYEMIWPEDVKENLSKRVVESAEQSFWERYGSPWQFNQIVGWVRLFLTGPQIRGDLWLVQAKRYVRNPRHKQFRLMGKVFEQFCYESQSSEEILAELRECLNRESASIRHRRLILDLENFDNLSRFIDWKLLVFNRDSAA